VACFFRKQDNLYCFKLIFFTFLLLYPFQRAISAELVNKNRIDLNQAIGEALKSNPKLRASRLGVISAEEKIKQSRASLLPSFDLSSRLGYDYTKTPVIHGTEFYKKQFTLTMTQLLFDASGTTYNIRLKKADAAAAEYQNFETSERVALEVTNGFLNILRQRDLIKIAKININKHRKILEKIRYGEEQGKFNKGDLAQAVARVTNAQINVENIKKSLLDANTAYKRVVGRLPSKYMIKPKANAKFLPDNVDKLIDQAREISPILASFRAKIDAAEAGYKSVKSVKLPSVNLQVAGTKGEDIAGINGKQTLGSALLTVKWNLYRGGANNSRIREAANQRRIAQANELDSLRKIENDIKNTWNARENTRINIKHLKKLVKVNKKVTEVYGEQFELNRRSLLDLLNTQNEFFVSQSNLITAVYSRLFADFRLMALRGNLVKTLGIKNNSVEKFKEKEEAEKPKPIKLKFGLLKFIGMKISPKYKSPILIIHKAEVKKSKIIKNKVLKEQQVVKKHKVMKEKKGLYYIQFASFKTSLKAKRILGKIVSENKGIFLGSITRVIRVDLKAKGIYYRLQVGVLTKKDAKKLCHKFKARKLGGCFIVRE